MGKRRKDKLKLQALTALAILGYFGSSAGGAGRSTTVETGELRLEIAGDTTECVVGTSRTRSNASANRPHSRSPT